MVKKPGYIQREDEELIAKYKETDGDMSPEEFIEKYASKKMKLYIAWVNRRHQRARERGVYI